MKTEDKKEIFELLLNEVRECTDKRMRTETLENIIRTVIEKIDEDEKQREEEEEKIKDCRFCKHQIPILGEKEAFFDCGALTLHAKDNFCIDKNYSFFKRKTKGEK